MRKFDAYWVRFLFSPQNSLECAFGRSWGKVGIGNTDASGYTADLADFNPNQQGIDTLRFQCSFKIVQKLPESLLLPALFLPTICLLWEHIDNTKHGRIMCKNEKDIVLSICFLSLFDRLYRQFLIKANCWVKERFTSGPSTLDVHVVESTPGAL